MSAPNLALRFVLELALLASLGYWGAHVPVSIWLQALLAVVAPVSSAVIWGAFVSPKARVPLPSSGRLAVELALFAAAATALAASGQRRLAVALIAGVAFHQGWRAAERFRGARQQFVQPTPLRGAV